MNKSLIYGYMYICMDIYEYNKYMGIRNVN